MLSRKPILFFPEKRQLIVLLGPALFIHRSKPIPESQSRW